MVNRGSRRDALPFTGIYVFMNEEKPLLQATEPLWTKMEVYRSLTKQWEELEEEEKNVYERKADYERRSKARLARLRQRRKGEKMAKLGPTVSPYAIFVRQQHGELKESNPELTLCERTKMISETWKRMNDDERTPFVNKAKRETHHARKAFENESDE